MQNKKIIIPLALLLLVIPFWVFSPKSAQASFLGDVVDKVKDFITPDPKREFTIDSDIALAPGGDIDNDGQIDSGDIIRFTYTIKNITEEEYSYATIKTDVNRKQLNFIHNILGTPSLTDDGETIYIPNFRVGANQSSVVSFDARINYFTKEDSAISTVGEFLNENKKSIAKSEKKSIKALKMAKDKIPSFINLELEGDKTQ